MPLVKQVLLLGTCMGSMWRIELGKTLNDTVKRIAPPDNLSPIELLAYRRDSYYILYVITPRDHSPATIAGLIEDAVKKNRRILFCFLDEEPMAGDNPETLTPERKAHLAVVREIARRNGATEFLSLKDVGEFLNHSLTEVELAN